MSELRDRLAEAQESSNTKEKELSELSKLKAKVHQLTMINQQLSDDNYRMKRTQKSAQLREQQTALENEFAAELDAQGKFDWNTLTFRKE